MRADVEGNEASLIGKSIRKDDAGQYACEIENPFGSRQNCTHHAR